MFLEEKVGSREQKGLLNCKSIGFCKTFSRKKQTILLCAKHMPISQHEGSAILNTVLRLQFDFARENPKLVLHSRLNSSKSHSLPSQSCQPFVTFKVCIFTLIAPGLGYKFPSLPSSQTTSLAGFSLQDIMQKTLLMAIHPPNSSDSFI